MSMSPFRVLALADSGFPAGGFAHSHGLEAHAAHGSVRSVDDLRRFTTDALWQAACAQGPLVRSAHDGRGSAHDGLRELDHTAEIRTTSPVQNRASRTQGRTFFATARGVFSGELARLIEVVQGLEYMHHAPVFGATLAELGLDLDDALTLYLFGQARGILSAGVRLGLLGPSESQSLLDELGPVLADARREARTRPLAEAAGTSPLLELRAGLHDALYSRLFLS